jgi:tRNA(fMet)-specific endonuclease VapC
MNGRYVLDTNIVIALIDEEPSVLARIAVADETLIPIVVLGELFYGANYSRRSAANVAKVEALAQSHTIVDLDLETARQYGIIKSELRRKGTPIPNNDIWIAALTQQYEAAIATRDQHFDAVEHLEVVRW